MSESTGPRSHQHALPRTEPKRTQLGGEYEILAPLSNSIETMDGPFTFIYVFSSETISGTGSLGENINTMYLNQICPVCGMCF